MIQKFADISASKIKNLPHQIIPDNDQYEYTLRSDVIRSRSNRKRLKINEELSKKAPLYNIADEVDKHLHER
jgi:hypothetical protein